MINVRRLEVFVAVAEERHFGRAAARLHIAQPSVSQHLQQLERELDLPLVRRDRRPLELTAAGDELLGEARAVLRRIGELEERISRVRSGTAGALRLGVPASLPPGLLPDLLARLRRFAPDVAVDTTAMSSSQAIDRLAHGELDAALIRHPPRPEGLRSVTLLDEPIGVALMAGHPLAAVDAVAPVALSGSPIAMPRAGSDRSFEERLLGDLERRGLERGPIVQCSEPDASRDLVAAGHAIWFTYARCVSEASRPASMAWRPVAGAPKVSIAATWAKDATNPAIHQLARAARDVRTNRRSGTENASQPTAPG